MRPGRLALVLLAVGCAVLAVAVLAFRSAAAPNPDPSLGPVVRVTSNSTATPHHSPTPKVTQEHDDDGLDDDPDEAHDGDHDGADDPD